MNLRQRLHAWAQPPEDADAAPPPLAQPSNVLALPTAEAAPAAAPAIPQGLLGSPELTAFFATPHFGYGRHDGAHYQAQAAMAQGRQAIITQFQLVLACLVAQRRSKADALRNMDLQTEGVCSTTSAQLDLACQRLERDMAELGAQSDWAADGRGWVLNALNEYQTGFGKGVRDAVHAALLGL